MKISSRFDFIIQQGSETRRKKKRKWKLISKTEENDRCFDHSFCELQRIFIAWRILHRRKKKKREKKLCLRWIFILLMANRMKCSSKEATFTLLLFNSFWSSVASFCIFFFSLLFFCTLSLSLSFFLALLGYFNFAISILLLLL